MPKKNFFEWISHNWAFWIIGITWWVATIIFDDFISVSEVVGAAIGIFGMLLIPFVLYYLIQTKVYNK